LFRQFQICVRGKDPIVIFTGVPPSWFNTELIDGIYWIISAKWIVILNYWMIVILSYWIIVILNYWIVDILNYWMIVIPSY
jgi:hypothetical protein